MYHNSVSPPLACIGDTCSLTPCLHMVSRCSGLRSLVAQKRRTVEVGFCAEDFERGAREAKVRDKRMSSDVKYVGLLAMEMI